MNGRSKRDRRRLEILRSAGETFRRRGFERAGMREIGEAVGMAPGNLYYYFRNKQEILYFCQDYALDRMIASAREILKSREPADARLRRLLEGQVRCMLEELRGTPAHAEFEALPSDLLKRVVAKRDRYEKILRGLIERGIRTRAFRPCDAGLVAKAMLGALNWTVKWWRPDGGRSVEEIAREFADYLVRGLA